MISKMKKTILATSICFLTLNFVQSREFEYAPADESEPMEMFEKYPINSDAITSGEFNWFALDNSELFKKTFISDMCIIGPEQLSQDWIKKDEIKELFKIMPIESFCIVTNLKNVEELHKIKDQWGKEGLGHIPLIPQKNIDLRAFGIKNYPIIIRSIPEMAYQGTR